MPTEVIQVALVDDHRLFRSGIASLINNFTGYKVLFEASNGKSFIEKIGKKQLPDIVLMDINMPEMDGIATTRWLQQHFPKVCVIILSMYGDADNVITLVKLGIRGYLLKDAEPQDFKEALDTVSNHDVYYPPFVTQHLIKNISFKAAYINLHLNERELDFLKHATTDLTYKEIAEAMSVSARTIDGYRDQLFEKLKVKSRVGLVLYAIKNKLIDV